MTTIVRIMQLKDWVAGKLQPQRIQREVSVEPTFPNAMSHQTVVLPLSNHLKIDRFESYRDKIVPNLRTCGYGYFLSCESDDYIEHQKWCDENCLDFSLPHCDVWQIDTKYPRAFSSKTDAAMFKVTFDAANILPTD